MEDQKKEKQIIEYLAKGGMIAVFFVGGFFVKTVYSIACFSAPALMSILESTTFNIILTSKAALSQDKAVF